MKKKIIRILKYSILSLLGILLIWCAVNYKLTGYLIYQGYGQISIVWKARPVEEVMKDPDFPDSLKAKLALIQEIRKFAIEQIGLNDTKNYTTLYDQRGKQIVWLVKACPPYELKPYQWKFPVFGSFGYLGFFNKDDALAEQERLKKSGFDTRIGNVGGWSTLGFFRDPILSNMLYRSEGDLADLIIHELTHATVFVPNKLQFNENLASFVGEKGAILFLESKFGKESKEYISYTNSLTDDGLFYDHILRGTRQLDSIYKSFSKSMADTLKHKLKYKHIQRIFQTIDTISFKDSTIKPNYRNLKGLPNNTYFIGFTMYRNDLSGMEKDYRENYQSDLRKFVAAMKKANN